jgi:hypothetical protein
VQLGSASTKIINEIDFHKLNLELCLDLTKKHKKLEETFLSGGGGGGERAGFRSSPSFIDSPPLVYYFLIVCTGIQRRQKVFTF